MSFVFYAVTFSGSQVKIYIVNDNLCVQRRSKKSEIMIALASGVYTVVVDDNAYKMVTKK